MRAPPVVVDQWDELKKKRSVAARVMFWRGQGAIAPALRADAAASAGRSFLSLESVPPGRRPGRRFPAPALLRRRPWPQRCRWGDGGQLSVRVRTRPPGFTPASPRRSRRGGGLRNRRSPWSFVRWQVQARDLAAGVSIVAAGHCRPPGSRRPLACMGLLESYRTAVRVPAAAVRPPSLAWPPSGRSGMRSLHSGRCSTSISTDLEADRGVVQREGAPIYPNPELPVYAA